MCICMKNNTKKYHIIETGYHLFNKNGYNGTGINDIIRQADIPKGSFYHYFESKENFAVEVIHFYSNLVFENIHNTLNDKNISPISRLFKLYKDFAGNFNNHKNFKYGGFASKLSHEVGDKSLPIRNAANDVFDRIHAVHLACLLEAQEIGEIKAKYDLKKLSKVIIFAWEGAIIRMKSTRTSQPLYDFIEMLPCFFS